MSIPESSIKRLNVFFNSLRGNSNLVGESSAEITPIISSDKSPRSNREVMKQEDLERYYAKPGEAEWGC
jgi:hypothetical protein